MGVEEMDQICNLFDSILRQVQPRGDIDYSIPEAFREQIASQAKDLAGKFPIR
jgi:hypothetical protein